MYITKEFLAFTDKHPACVSVANAVTHGYCTGWLAITFIIAAGKGLSKLRGSDEKVSKLMGNLATPAARRAIAIGTCVYYTLAEILPPLLPNMKAETLRKNPILSKAFSIIRAAVLIGGACLAADATTHSRYKKATYLIYPIALLVLLHRICLQKKMASTTSSS